MSPQIVVISGPLSGRTFPLGDTPLLFGRTAENSVLVASPLASRRHAEVRRDGDGYLLADLGSSNGTLLNGQRITAQRLRPGDVFSIGDEAFRFEAPAALAVGVGLPPQVSAQRPLPPPPGFGLPPAGAATPAAPRRAGRALPLLIGIGVLLVCVLLAALAGGAVLLSRVGGIDAAPTGGPLPAPTRAPASPAPTLAAEAPEAPAAPTAPLPDGAAAWTVLVYLDGDNNLESDALDDFREMAAVGSSDQLKIVVQLDRISSSEPWDDSSAGDWDGTRRFLVERGMRPSPDLALEDLGEQNMGDPATLADFVTWGVEQYPARRYALIIWDHGASWFGIASDDSADGDMLSLPELSSALSNAQQRSGVATFDLIGFDACLMAQLDVFQAIQPFGAVGVASAELEPNTGWAWDAWLGQLAANPDQDARAIAPVIVDTYIDSYSDAEADEVTLSAFDLERLEPLVRSLDALSAAMSADIGPAYTAIGQARSFVDVYAPAYPEEFNAIDLGHFVALLPEQGAPPPVAAAARAVGSAITDARLASRAGSYHRNSSGLSIYFPQLPDLYIDAYGRGSPLPRLTGWDEFLQSYYGAADGAISRPIIGDLQIDRPVASVNSPVNLSGSVSGNDIAYVFSFIGVPNQQRDTVSLTDVDFVYPPGAGPGADIPDWQNGQHDLHLSWDATSWYLSNGADEIPVLLGPVRYGSQLYGVEGVYTSRATGEQIDAGLIFTLSQGQGTLARIWGFPRGNGSQEPQPFELEPAPGDSFTAAIRTYTDSGDTLDPGRVEGETITFGDQPMRVRRGPTRSGEYVIGFLVRDIAGAFSYRYLDVTVDNSGASTQPSAPTPAASAPGVQPGYLAYANPGLGFAIEHPERWQAFDTGREKIIFYDPDANDAVYVSIDIYSLGLASPSAANSDILAQLLDLVTRTASGELRVPESDFSAAGQPGRRIDYVYRTNDGATIYVSAVAITAPSSGRTYLITMESPEERFDKQLPIFNVMIETFTIE